MKNISKPQLERVRKQITELIAETNRSLDWCNKFLKEDYRKSTASRIKKCRRSLRKIEYAITQNPSSALYGESQVGKSYLIKNLLSRANEPFMVLDMSSGQQYNFLEEINPKGEGAEATSVVTRFSTQVEIIDPQFPVRIHLLSPKDIILLLCDSYFSDVEYHISLPNYERINAHIASLDELFKPTTHTQSVLSDDDVYEIREYLAQHFKNFTGDVVNSDFWDYVADHIHKADPDNWFRVFQILWGNNSHINKIFNTLIGQLRQLEFAPVVFAEFKSVLRKHGTILHVARLKEINGEPLFEDVDAARFVPTVNITLPTPSGIKRQNIHKSMLCALTAELVLKVENELEAEKPFLESTDLLDFPGARSRLKNHEDKLNETHIGDMVLRGKVSYIFNKYSADYLISNLLFCNKNEKIEVTYIPRLLNNWIETYIGNSPESRQQFLQHTPLPPLFVIFTFFNKDMEYNPINDREDTLHEKWIKRFDNIFVNNVVSNNFDWHRNWTPHTPFFQNNYMLRDFYYSHTLFEGYREAGTEKVDPIPVKPFPNYYEKLRQSFIGHEFVKNHFSSPVKAWDSAARANHDGSELIIQNLNQVSNNVARTQKFINELNRLRQEIHAEMDRHHHKDEGDKRIQKAAEQAGIIRLNIDTVFKKDPSGFGRFVKDFIIRESVVYNFFKDKLTSLELIENSNVDSYVLIRFSNPGLSMSKSFEENVAVLMRTYNFKSVEELEKNFEKRQIDLKELFYGQANHLKNNSLALAESLREYWFEHYLNFSRFEPFIQKGFSREALGDLFDHIRVAFAKHGITERIAQNLREYVDRFDKIDDAHEMIADISAGIINKFVTNMGWGFYSEGEIEKMKSTDHFNRLDLNFDVDSSLPMEENADLAQLFDHLQNYNALVSEVSLNHEAVKNFPNISNISRWKDLMKISFVASCDIPTYDPLANEALGLLLQKLSQYHFQLTADGALN